MQAAFRRSSDAEKLGVLKAHPDLAGKLAQAGELTAESRGEQASAGLDRLTSADRSRFEVLNAEYVVRFGFPFIIAVKGRTTAEILAAFEARIRHDRNSELQTAAREVEKIAAIRIAGIFGEQA
jgi:OHCU decarboxylase